MSNFAWVTLATNDSYSLGALVVAYSLKRVHTAHQLAVLITPGVSESMRNKLRTVFNLVQEVNLLDSQDAGNLALLKRPELGVTFTKLHCWRLTQFEKCVFLDADTLVIQNCDELFEREELSAAPDVGWPDCFNSGVYVFKPNAETYANLIQFAVTNGSFDGGDQGLLNQFFSDWAHKDISKHLPFTYNTSSVATYSYIPAFKQYGENVKILHFIGAAKPWLQNFNSESKKVHVPGGFTHLAQFLQFWWDIFCEDVHSRLSPDMSGIAGALSKLTLGEPKTHQQEEYEEHMRRQYWESGNIDYMGKDSFENIWRRIQQTIGTVPKHESSAPQEAPKRHSKSRSRSSTPKRDMRDRSPTPQPEDVLPVEKKEVQIEPAIQEEEAQDDNANNMDKSPPLLHYDPTTNTTTLTKKVFAGYQQIITTKTPEGKTKTQTKTFYDPSVDVECKSDEDIEQLIEKTPVVNIEVKQERVVAAAVAAKPEPIVEKVQATAPVSVRKPSPAPVRYEPTPVAAPPPQLQLQEHESLAGYQGGNSVSNYDLMLMLKDIKSTITNIRDRITSLEKNIRGSRNGESVNLQSPKQDLDVILSGFPCNFDLDTVISKLNVIYEFGTENINNKFKLILDKKASNDKIYMLVISFKYMDTKIYFLKVIKERGAPLISQLLEGIDQHNNGVIYVNERLNNSNLDLKKHVQSLINVMSNE